jgi:Flp pilus assembly CpaE family ATPase
VPSALSAVNVGKPLAEAAPNSPIVKALRPLVAALDRPDDEPTEKGRASAARAFMRFTQGLKLKRK